MSRPETFGMAFVYDVGWDVEPYSLTHPIAS